MDTANAPLARPVTSHTSPSKGLHIGLWVAQALLAATFLMSGGTKVSTPIEVLRVQMPWFNGALGGAARFIGVAELLGAVGVVLPAATRILPWLTPLASAGLTTVMVLAAITHATRGELPLIAVTGTIGALAAFVAWGRFRKAPILPRG